MHESMVADVRARELQRSQTDKMMQQEAILAIQPIKESIQDDQRYVK